MTVTTRQIRLIAAFAGVNLVLAVGGWRALVSPQQHDAATAAAQAQAAEDELNVLLGQGQHGPVEQPEIHTAALYSLDTALPSQVDQPNLLFELERVAKASDVELINISPQMPQGTANGLTVVPISLSLNGSYFHVTSFLHNLRTLVSERHGRLVANGPLFSVTSVTLTPADDPNEAPATVAIAAYYYGLIGGASAPAAATDTTTTPTGG